MHLISPLFCTIGQVLKEATIALFHVLSLCNIQRRNEAELLSIRRELEARTAELDSKMRELDGKTRELEGKNREVEGKTRELQNITRVLEVSGMHIIMHVHNAICMQGWIQELEEGGGLF